MGANRFEGGWLPMDAILLSTMALYYRKLKNARKYLQFIHQLRVFSALFYLLDA